MIGSSNALVGIVGDFSDPTNERIIYLSAAGLALLGLGLLLGTIVWWRRGRQEHPALAPLEVMSARAWAKAPAGDRRRRLDRVRIAGAGANEDEPVRAEPLDLEALVRNTPQAFDDLREPGESADGVPEATDEPVVAAAEAEAEVDGEAEVALAAEPDTVEPVEVEPVAVEPVEVEPVAVEPVAVADVAAPAKEPTPAAPKPAPAAVDRDATQVSTQRPSQSVDVLASGPPDPML